KKALDMAEYNYVGHTTQNGMGILEFASFAGITIKGSIGENVAGGNISDLSLQDGLEESGSHRHAMTEDKYKKIGIGYVLKNGKTYLVQLFGE
ncbi:CAP domain-containing protein, partial [Candidatus Gracilibacteria bacterium]|nr:CAP domain-containing protein [Candidatus Gracilibacteria bacterium]